MTRACRSSGREWRAHAPSPNTFSRVRRLIDLKLLQSRLITHIFAMLPDEQSAAELRPVRPRAGN